MRRSFRAKLAWRFTLAMSLATLVVGVVGYVALRRTLDRQINASLLNVASIQAAAVTSDPAGDMQFQEWELTPEEAASIRDINRYAQVWNELGDVLLRSQYLTHDLPLDRSALDAAVNGDLAWTESSFEESHIRSLYYPLGRLGPSHARHVLQVAAPLVARDRTLSILLYLLGGVVVLVGSGTFLGSWWLAGRTIRPVHEIIDQSESIGADTLGKRIRADADTQEYDRLVQVLNTMLERIDAAFEAQRRFTADASHELRSPLTALRGELELALRRERTDEEYRRVIGSALEETERLSRLAEDLLTLARADAGAMEPRFALIRADETVRKTLARLGPEAERKGVSLAFEGDPEARLCCDPELIGRLVWNLVDNAIRFTTPSGNVLVSVSCANSNGEVRISVADTGPGIREEELGRVFDRFYRADAAHGDTDGTGLGLAIVRAIARAHGGTVTAENAKSGGATFTVRLPVVPRRAIGRP